MYYYYSDEIARLTMIYSPLSQYTYVWSPAARSFVRYTSRIYDPHDQDAGLGNLVATLPMERLPIRKALTSPMIFSSPIRSCQWVASITGGIPATYSGQPIVTGRLGDHVQPNGLIINVSELTFSWSDADSYHFSLSDDAVILTVLDTDGTSIRPSGLFEPGEMMLVADNPRQAEMIIKHILSLKL